MLKKTLFISLLILTMAASLVACGGGGTTENPDEIIEDGLVFAPYNEEKTEYELIKMLDSREELTVPAEIAGKPVVSIGNSAFYNNNTLKKATLPENITVICDYAFDNCTALEEISFSPFIERIGFNAFSDCERLKEIKLPENLKLMESSSFARCTSLEKIHVNPALESIERDSFIGCESISEIYISDVSAWCRIAFENIEANPICKAERLYVSGEITEEITVTGAETISEYAFFRFSGLKKLTLGEGVVNVSDSAFSNCTSLRRLEISDSVKKIGVSAFNSCTSLEYIVMGGGIEYFSGLAFYNCTSLYALEIKDIFAWCEAFFYTDSTGTANPLIYADVIVIDGEEITELKIPEGVKKISTLSFIGFKGTKVILPSSLKTVADTAFYMCDNLTALHFNGTLEELKLLSIGSNNFEKITEISYNR